VSWLRRSALSCRRRKQNRKAAEKDYGNEKRRRYLTAINIWKLVIGKKERHALQEAVSCPCCGVGCAESAGWGVTASSAVSVQSGDMETAQSESTGAASAYKGTHLYHLISTAVFQLLILFS